MADIVIGKAGHEWEIVGHEHRKNLENGKRDVLVLIAETPCCGCTIKRVEEDLENQTFCPICDEDPEDFDA